MEVIHDVARENSAVGEKEDHFKAEARPFLDHQETPGGKGGREERHEGRRVRLACGRSLANARMLVNLKN